MSWTATRSQLLARRRIETRAWFGSMGAASRTSRSGVVSALEPGADGRTARAAIGDSRRLCGAGGSAASAPGTTPKPRAIPRAAAQPQVRRARFGAVMAPSLAGHRTPGGAKRPSMLASACGSLARRDARVPRRPRAGGLWLGHGHPAGAVTARLHRHRDEADEAGTGPGQARLRRCGLRRPDADPDRDRVRWKGPRSGR